MNGSPQAIRTASLVMSQCNIFFSEMNKIISYFGHIVIQKCRTNAVVSNFIFIIPSQRFDLYIDHHQEL